MLIPFRSKACADFFMLEPHAKAMFELMGKPFTLQGVIAGSDAQRYLSQLNQALITHATHASSESESGAADDEPSSAQQSVGLKQRAWPLLDMLARASAKNADVIWGVD